MITKYSADGKKLKSVAYTGGEQYFHGTKQPFDNGNTSLQVRNGIVTVFFARTMFKSDDGLNHQSSTALYVDAESFKKLDYKIPYVSHTFDNYVTNDEDNILFVDRGDAYDRGFVIQKLNTTNNTMEETVPFYFKLGETYQYTYSQLGGLAVTKQGYTLVGTSETSFGGKAVASEQSESRNLFIQLIDRNFTSDTDNAVISKGQDISFNLNFRNAKNVTNKEVVWLTNYKDPNKDNAVNPKFVTLPNDTVLILWENMIKNKYKTTYYMIVSPDGKVLYPAEELKDARLNIGAWPVYSNGYVYWSNGENKNVYLYRLNVKDKIK